jgi:DNA helicase MCM8
MYGDNMKGHQPKGSAIDATTVDGLAAVWRTYFPEEAGFSVSDRKVRIAAALVASSFSTVVKKLQSRVSTRGRSHVQLALHLLFRV